MKVAALTSGASTPSARFRVRQYMPYLRELGVEVADYCPVISQGARLPGRLGRIRARYVPPIAATQMVLNLALRTPGIVGSHFSDITWLERNFVPGLDIGARLLKRPLVVDIDDAIWLYNPFGTSAVKSLVRQADMIFAGNNFLADWCSAHNKNVHIIPTAVDADRFSPAATGAEKPDRPFVIGWTGTSGNFKFLASIERALSSFLRDHPDAKFLVVADRRPDMPTLPPEQLQFEAWNPEIEHLALRKMNVGIMPIDDSDLSRGKCSFKMLQYMASGLPVVVSPYGMNRTVMNLGHFGVTAISADEWYGGLKKYYVAPQLAADHGKVAREILLREFHTPVIAKNIWHAFKSLS